MRGSSSLATEIPSFTECGEGREGELRGGFAQEGRRVWGEEDLFRREEGGRWEKMIWSGRRRENEPIEGFDQEGKEEHMHEGDVSSLSRREEEGPS